MDEYSTYQEMAVVQREGVDYAIEHRVLPGRAAVLAIHGGAIERHSDTIARVIAGSEFSYYLLIGKRKTENRRYLHIASHRYVEPRALSVVADAPAVVTVHGHRSTTESFMMLGGLNRSAVARLMKSFSQMGIATQPCTAGLAGSESGNICNRGATGAGVQLELSMKLRQDLITNESLSNVFCRIVRTDLLRPGDRQIPNE